MKKIVVNLDTGVSKRVDLTVDEVAQKEAAEAKVKAAEEAIIAAQQAEVQAETDAKIAQDAVDAQIAIDKASARVKLKATEYTPLTEAEADALTI